MPVHIALFTLILPLILFITSPSFSQNYTNKDVELLKSQQKSTPTYKPSKVKTHKDNKTKSAVKTTTSSVKGQAQKTPASVKAAKTSQPAKSPAGINYSSPDGSIRIEVKSKKTASAAGGTAPVKSAARKGGAPRAGENVSGKTDEITALDDIEVTTGLLPYEEWKSEYSDYFYRHYNDDKLSLTPSMIVIRSTSSKSTDDIINLYKRGSLYDEGNEGALYGHLSCHFVMGRHGEIIQTLPLNIRSKGAYGVNHKAITIELVGMSSQEIINNTLQKQALYALVTSLMKRFQIPLNRVYGHYEVARGKAAVPDYTEFDDSDYPDYYSPDKMCYDPGEIYMEQLRNNFARQTSKGQ